MSDSTREPFAAYTAQIMAGLKALSAEQRDAIMRELQAHLEDAALERGQSPNDPVLQHQVMAELGRTDALITGFRRAYGAPRSFLRWLGVSITLIGCTLLMLFPAFGLADMPTIYQSLTATESWSGRECVQGVGCIWTAVPQTPDFIGPWLLGGLLFLLCGIGGLLAVGAILQWHGQESGQRMVHRALLGLLVVLVLSILFAVIWADVRSWHLLWAPLGVGICGMPPIMLGLALLRWAQRPSGVSPVR